VAAAGADVHVGAAVGHAPQAHVLQPLLSRRLHTIR
jgi:hypothetical protein